MDQPESGPKFVGVLPQQSLDPAARRVSQAAGTGITQRYGDGGGGRGVSASAPHTRDSHSFFRRHKRARLCEAGQPSAPGPPVCVRKEAILGHHILNSAGHASVSREIQEYRRTNWVLVRNGFV